jgi:MOSC domain-containing protein YiiM
MTGRLLAVSVVHTVIPDVSGLNEQTAIDKRPVDGRVAVRATGLDGDRQCDLRHGGPDQAVYAYAGEDAAWWAAELGRELTPGRFGENLTTAGLDLTGAVIGERWRVGTTELQVRSPRIPCATFQGFWDVPQLVRRFTEHGAPGVYLGVLAEGEIGAGDAVEVLDRPAHGLTVGEFFRAWTTDRALLPRVAECPDVPQLRRDQVRERLERTAAPGSAATPR